MTDMETRGLIGGEMEDVALEAEKLLALDVKRVVYHLEHGSVYGTAIAFPQLARCSNYNKVYVALWIRAWLALALNIAIQLSLVVFVGEATQIMNPLGGMMHLCDFGANLDICEGPGTTVPGCQGPGGTQYSPPRLYGYTQWAVQKFTKQALLDVLPDQEETINAKVDPGEYGMENWKCRFVCLFLFTLSVLHEIVTCMRLGLLLVSVPHAGEKEMSWITNKREGFRTVAKYRAGGMPIYWKVIIFLVVFLPKLALCHYVLLEGTLLLMDTSGILDCVLGALSMSFVLSIDEMLYDAMTSGAAVSIMKKLEAALEEEEIAQEKAEAAEIGSEHPKGTSWCSIAVLRQIIPLRIVAALVVMGLYVGRYYQFKCKYSEEWEMWVSKDMYTPTQATYSVTDFILNGFFQTISHGDEPFWTMK